MLNPCSQLHSQGFLLCCSPRHVLRSALQPRLQQPAMPAAIWSGSTIRLVGIHVSCLMSCLCPLYMLLCSLKQDIVYQRQARMCSAVWAGDHRATRRGSTCMPSTQSITMVPCMQTSAVSLSLALTSMRAMTADLACRHYAHHPTSSSQMASMTLSRPVGQQSTSLTPSQLQSMVGG